MKTIIATATIASALLIGTSSLKAGEYDPTPVGPLSTPAYHTQANNGAICSAKLPVCKKTKMRLYTVQKGDSFRSIARCFKVSQFSLRRVNNSLIGRIFEGQVLMIPREVKGLNITSF